MTHAQVDKVSPITNNKEWTSRTEINIQEQEQQFGFARRLTLTYSDENCVKGVWIPISASVFKFVQDGSIHFVHLECIWLRILGGKVSPHGNFETFFFFLLFPRPPKEFLDQKKRNRIQDRNRGD